MTKIIIATHGPLAEALKESSEMFFADKSESIQTIGLYPEDSPTDLFAKLKSVVEADPQEEYLILVDIFSGTPFNTVGLLLEEYPALNIQCLTGVNLPMVMEVLSLYETMSLDELLVALENIGCESIINMRKFLEI